jgi:hypothetical protein
MDDSQREQLQASVPEDPAAMAEMSYYLEHMTPEIDRLERGLQGHAMEGGTEFDQSALQQMTGDLPRSIEDLEAMGSEALSIVNLGAGGYDQQLGQRDFDSVRESLEDVAPTPGVIALQAYMLEQELDPNTLDKMREMDSAAQIGAYKEDFAEWNPEQTPWESEPDATIAEISATTHDVVAEGEMDVGKDLEGMFVKADAHEGPESLETIHMEQQAALETSDPEVTNAQTLG